METIPAPVAMLLNTPPTPSGLPQYRTLLVWNHPREPDATDRTLYVTLVKLVYVCVSVVHTRGDIDELSTFKFHNIKSAVRDLQSEVYVHGYGILDTICSVTMSNCWI